MVRNIDLSHAPQKHLNAEYLKGLINVVPLRGLGTKQGAFVWVGLQYKCIANCSRNGSNCAPYIVGSLYSYKPMIR